MNETKKENILSLIVLAVSIFAIGTIGWSVALITNDKQYTQQDMDRAVKYHCTPLTICTYDPRYDDSIITSTPTISILKEEKDCKAQGNKFNLEYMWDDNSWNMTCSTHSKVINSYIIK